MYIYLERNTTQKGQDTRKRGRKWNSRNSNNKTFGFDEKSTCWKVWLFFYLTFETTWWDPHNPMDYKRLRKSMQLVSSSKYLRSPKFWPISNMRIFFSTMTLIFHCPLNKKVEIIGNHKGTYETELEQRNTILKFEKRVTKSYLQQKISMY